MITDDLEAFGVSVPPSRTVVTPPESGYWLVGEGGLRINRITVGFTLLLYENVYFFQKVSGTEIYVNGSDPLRKTFTIVGNTEKDVKLAEKLMGTHRGRPKNHVESPF